MPFLKNNFFHQNHEHWEESDIHTGLLTEPVSVEPIEEIKNEWKEENQEEEIEDENVAFVEESLSLWKLIALTLCFAGVQFGWAIQIAFTTPIFLELGIGKDMVSLIWLAGPISGMLVQPVVGVLSDSSKSRFGRRRPFIFGGTLAVLLGMLLISNATSIGEIFQSNTKQKNPVAIAIAVIGFWVLDLANNTIQGPCRALLVDVAPPHQQALGNSLFSIMLGLGNLLGYLIGSLKLTDWFPFFKTDLRALFTIAMVFLLVTITITLISTKEKNYVEKKGVQRSNPFVNIGKALLKTPKAMRRVCVVQFFTWIGWFTFFLFITDWMAEDIFHGDPDKDSPQHGLYQDGVRAGSLGLTLNAVITIVCSLALPYLIKILGVKTVYFIGEIVLALCLCLSVLARDKVFGLLLICFTGIPWTVTMVLPFSLVGQIVGPEKSGIYIGVLNIFIVVPQLLVSFSMGLILKYIGEDPANALFIGGSSVVFGAVAVFFLIIPEQSKQKNFEEENGNSSVMGEDPKIE